MSHQIHSRTSSSSHSSESWSSSDDYYTNNNNERSLQISKFYWAYAPTCVLCFFFTFLLTAKKLKKFHNTSLRHHLAHYINAEHMYKTLRGADDQAAQKHTQLERGHLIFVFLSQIILDFILLSKGYVHVVRGTNSKLRFAHSSYQSLLFALDSSSSDGESFARLPIGCYIWACTHFLYEAGGEIVEGCVMSGSVDLALVVAVVSNAIQNEEPATGKIAAFGLTCLGLSCASLVGSMIYKLIAIRLTKRRWRVRKIDDNNNNNAKDDDAELVTVVKFQEPNVVEVIKNNEEEEEEVIDQDEGRGGFFSMALRRKRRGSSRTKKQK